MLPAYTAGLQLHFYFRCLGMYFAGVFFDPDSTPSQVQTLLDMGQVQTFSRRSVVSEAGQQSPAWVHVNRGVVGLRVAARPDEPAVWTDLLTAGQSWAAAPSGALGLSVVELVALSTCEIQSLPHPVYRELCRISLPWAQAQLTLTQRALLRCQVRRAVDSLPLESKLAYFWWSLSSPTPEGYRLFYGHISQQILASFLRVSREEVSRKTQMLEKAGYLQVENQRVVVYPDVSFLLSFQEQWASLFEVRMESLLDS